MEIVADKEKKLRQSLASMGLHDLSYWLSLHIYYSIISFLQGLSVVLCGYICQLRFFVKNDFLVLLLTFWLSNQAFAGISFMLSGLANKTGALAAKCGMVIFVSFQVKSFIDQGIPYGSYKSDQIPMSLERNITSGNYTLSNDAWVEPVFSIFPTSLFYKNVQDLSDIVAAEDSEGLRLAHANSYCSPENTCFWHFSVASSWGIYILHYIILSFLGIYFDNVMPDALGVKKHPLYFLDPYYWGFVSVSAEDSVLEIKDPTNPAVVLNRSTDEDVLEEERLCQERITAPDSERESWAIEVRGLTQKFARKEKGPGEWIPKSRDFYAVKAPWFSIGKRQLFALLGPNGAGKTTMINMLTGFLPVSTGNAVVLHKNAINSADMAQIRRRMGVCPQFDTLWDGLTAREHLLLFGAIKGLAPASVPIEAQRLLEEVRLTDSADILAGHYSGGMRRRLSVAIALVGDPAVVYLDEPTTGMDPINRRHVWNLIEKSKQERTIILTTHSMEEADILGDRVAIIAKGRLRCIGTSVRLKSRYGKGYRVSLSFDPSGGNSSGGQQVVSSLFKDSFGSEPEPDISSYLHFNVPSTENAKLAALFGELEQRKEALGILDVQIGMSSLEDVFLTIARNAELEDAEERGLRTKIPLCNGEQVQVTVGDENDIVSPKGIRFRVTWTSDEEGKLIVGEVVEDETSAPVDNTTELDAAGHELENDTEHGEDRNKATSSVANMTAPVPNVVYAVGESDTAQVSALPEVEASTVQTQATALLRKSVLYQLEQRKNNCCLLLCPLVSVGIVVLIQFLLFLWVTGEPFSKCVYCGPDDSFAKQYCRGQNCTDFFTPNWLDGYDKKSFTEQCQLTAQTCGGQGNFDCWQPQYSQKFGYILGKCPSKSARETPVLRYAPPPTFRADHPVLYTSAEQHEDFASKISEQLYSDGTDESKSKMAGARRALSHDMYQLLSALPLLSCDVNVTDTRYLAGVCMMMQHGLGAEPCCTDLSNESLTSEGVIPKQNVNFWTPDASFNETRWNSEVIALGNNATARQAVKIRWEQHGVRFGEGMEARNKLTALSYEALPVFGSQLARTLSTNEPFFSCVKPSQDGPAAQVLGNQTCTRFEEGLVLLADALQLPVAIMPKIKPKSIERWHRACENHTIGDELRFNASMTLSELQAELALMPCGCRWLSLISTLIAPLAFPKEKPGSMEPFQLPHVYDCPKVRGQYICAPGHNVMHLLSIPGLKLATSVGPANPDFGPDRALKWDGWEPEIETEWERAYFGSGQLSAIVDNCTVFAGEMCFLDKVAGLLNMEFDCISAQTAAVLSKDAMLKRIYDGVWAPYAPKPVTIQERIVAYDFANSDNKRLNVTLMYNNTIDLGKTIDSILWSAGFADKRQERIAAFLSDAVDAFVNANKAVNAVFHGALRGVKEMPAKTHKDFTLDLTVAMTSAFCVTVMVALPMIVEAVMHEKERKLHIMMQMMGLSPYMYWCVVWLYWSLLYLCFIVFFYSLTAAIMLPDGWRVSIFIKNDSAVVFIFLFLASQHAIATALLIASMWPCYPGAENHAKRSTWIMLLFMNMLVSLLIDQGGVFMGIATVSRDSQNLLTLIPYISVFRGLAELAEYASQANNGSGGLTWAKMSDASEGCGMGAVMTTLFLETLAFFVLAQYLDQVLDTGLGVPRHPLFFLGFTRSQAPPVADVEASAGDASLPEDVETEANRVKALLSQTNNDSRAQETVVITDLQKIYPGRKDQPPKVAVKSLTLGVRQGECFGMLGPNGAGKTTSISCLTGIAQPTSGDAFIGGMSIRSHMSRIYKLMGVCPQHDILWDVLTAAQHMEFYGALKHLKGMALKKAATDGLRSVSLLNWKDQKVSSFSGGMKRRLSVAIAMIGSPIVCYLDEPSTGLDPASRRTLWKCIKAAKQSRALFLTTHSMEEAEELCDRIGIFVSGALRCVDRPKALASRFGGFFLLTVTTSSPERAQEVVARVQAMCDGKARITYALGTTQKFEVPATHVVLSQVFSVACLELTADSVSPCQRFADYVDLRSHGNPRPCAGVFSDDRLATGFGR